jgi:hypothetical protein
LGAELTGEEAAQGQVETGHFHGQRVLQYERLRR